MLPILCHEILDSAIPQRNVHDDLWIAELRYEGGGVIFASWVLVKHEETVSRGVSVFFQC